MLLNIVSVLVLVGLAALFVFLAARAWRSRRAYIKFPGVILAGLLALVFAVVTVTTIFGFYKMSAAPHKYGLRDIQASNDPAVLARGERLAGMCTGCHSSNGQLPLTGSNMIEVGVPPMGTLYASNLTPAGQIKDWSDAEIARAIREGVDKDSKPLVIMPSYSFRAMSDEDITALVSYLRTQPAVESEYKERNLNLLGALVFGAGMLPPSAQEPITAPVVAPTAAVSVEYGQYIVNFAGCKDCHGADLHGSAGGIFPAGPDLSVNPHTWSSDQFVTLFRTGMLPNGRALTDSMPWYEYDRAFSDDELKAIHAFLSTLDSAAAQTK